MRAFILLVPKVQEIRSFELFLSGRLNIVFSLQELLLPFLSYIAGCPQYHV